MVAEPPITYHVQKQRPCPPLLQVLPWLLWPGTQVRSSLTTCGHELGLTFSSSSLLLSHWLEEGGRKLSSKCFLPLKVTLFWTAFLYLAEEPLYCTLQEFWRFIYTFASSAKTWSEEVRSFFFQFSDEYNTLLLENITWKTMASASSNFIKHFSYFHAIFNIKNRTKCEHINHTWYFSQNGNTVTISDFFEVQQTLLFT